MSKSAEELSDFIDFIYPQQVDTGFIQKKERINDWSQGEGEFAKIISHI